MSLTKAKKQEVTKELADKFSRKKIAIFSDFHGVSVAKLQALRRLLRKDQSEYKVSKKTLLDRALTESGIPLKTKEMQGELGVTFGYGDEVLPAKTLLKFGKENETFKILGGILGNRLLSAKEIMALARLPAREVLLTQVAGTLSTPIRGLVTVLNGNIKNLVVVLSKIKDKK
jgi:large subunit ribosomal protein L10